MKFLVDACAGGRLGLWLREQGHDVIDLASTGAPGLGDEVILARAHRENRILVTLDKDFGELVVYRLQEHHGVVRLPSLPIEQRIALLMQVLEEHCDDLARGALVTARGAKLRVSWPNREKRG